MAQAHHDALDFLSRAENNYYGLMYWYLDGNRPPVERCAIVTFYSGLYYLECANDTLCLELAFTREGILNVIEDYKFDVIDLSEGQYLYTGITFGSNQ